MDNRTYTCSLCGGTFEMEWTDEEAVAEMNRDFGSIPLDQCKVVCDDCYQRIRPDLNPEKHQNN